MNTYRSNRQIHLPSIFSPNITFSLSLKKITACCIHYISSLLRAVCSMKSHFLRPRIRHTYTHTRRRKKTKQQRNLPRLFFFLSSRVYLFHRERESRREKSQTSHCLPIYVERRNGFLTERDIDFRLRKIEASRKRERDKWR